MMVSIVKLKLFVASIPEAPFQDLGEMAHISNTVPLVVSANKVYTTEESGGKK